MLSHLSPALLGVGWAYFVATFNPNVRNLLMSVIKLRSRGMLGQRKADLGLKAAQRKKQHTRTSLIHPKFPRSAIVKTPQLIYGKYLG